MTVEVCQLMTAHIYMANQFNDTTREVVTYHTCPMGLSLHYNCSDIVMLEPVIKANRTLQAIGRVHRLGQSTNGTYGIYQAKIWRRVASGIPQRRYTPVGSAAIELS